MSPNGFRRGFQNRDDGIGFHHSSIGDEDIEFGDSVCGFELGDGGQGVGFGSGIDFYGYDFTVLAEGDGGEDGEGGGKSAYGGDDDGVWAGNQFSEEAFADSAVGAGDEVGGFGHAEKIAVMKCGTGNWITELVEA